MSSTTIIGGQNTNKISPIETKWNIYTRNAILTVDFNHLDKYNYYK